MSRDFIPFNRPSITDAECEAVVDTLKSLWLTTGPKTKLFEEKFVELTGAESALALNSCTAGLHLGLKALGVGPGDEVITTPLTFCATANVIEHLGATTVLADIDPDTWLVSPTEIEKKITPKTKVILPVHYAGNMCDMTAINSIARAHNIKVLEDCAHCLPNTYEDGTYVGGNGNLCAFSFYANKNITTGEGGMLVGPTELIEKVRSLSLHGMDMNAWRRFDKSGSWQYDVVAPGFKYNMTDMQAGLGLVQMSTLSEFYEKRKSLAQIYSSAFSRIERINQPVISETSSYHIYPVAFEAAGPVIRDSIIEKMKSKGIGVSVHYQPIYQFSYYKQKYGWEEQSFPVASIIGHSCLTLPLFPSLSTEDCEYVAQSLIEVLEPSH